MDSIANDNTMCKEMIATVMNSKNGKMAMMENHEAMMKMMESCKNDTATMHSMCKAMMGNKQMLQMMMEKNKR